MILYTIGFTKKSAETFFGLLKQPGLERIIDVRYNNTSQLAGFTKRDDLAFFLRRLRGLDYVYLPELAPTKESRDAYMKRGGDWEAYIAAYRALLDERCVAETLDKSLFDGGCLLCSEATADHCHRRLLAEYLAEHWGHIEIVHL